MRIPVRSTQLAAVEYDPIRLLLEVVFHDGAEYVFSGVPQEIFEGLLASPSKGRYFLTHVRNRFRYWRGTASEG